MVHTCQTRYATSQGKPGVCHHHPASNAAQPPPTPWHAFASIGLPPIGATPTLHPHLALETGSEVVYRPFPRASPEHQGIPAVVVPSDTPAYLFAIRFSYAPGDYRMLAFPTGGFFTSVNEVLHAVRTAIGSAGAEPEPEEAGEAREGRMRVDREGNWVWTGFTLGRDDVWELSLF
ncbi:hypothetical protein BDQ12DRAFT_69521 [Crucibulum laeve]|uniref:Uncharacterized protein n=1 Tax=Crucibulum laeve TaxID=68775 RepID=A0A5C3M3E1_9AGAR|nr:hypothetical protein BDQ12DRAFT_69521 [Crucibulum laeve]